MPWDNSSISGEPTVKLDALKCRPAHVLKQAFLVRGRAAGVVIFTETSVNDRMHHACAD